MDSVKMFKIEKTTSPILFFVVVQSFSRKFFNISEQTIRVGSTIYNSDFVLKKSRFTTLVVSASEPAEHFSNLFMEKHIKSTEFIAFFGCLNTYFVRFRLLEEQFFSGTITFTFDKVW